MCVRQQHRRADTACLCLRQACRPVPSISGRAIGECPEAIEYALVKFEFELEKSLNFVSGEIDSRRKRMEAIDLELERLAGAVATQVYSQIVAIADGLAASVACKLGSRERFSYATETYKFLATFWGIATVSE